MHELSDLREYSERLRTYSLEELEDIYFNIHILRHPVRYRLVVMELERRKLAPGEAGAAVRPLPDLRVMLERSPFWRRHPLLRAFTLSALLYAGTTAVTLAFFAPIWLFAMPLHFIGLQTAIVYFACAPIPLVMGAGIGGRLGGRGFYAVFVLLAIVTAAVLFNATGAPSAIIRTIIEPQKSGGLTFGGF